VGWIGAVTATALNGVLVGYGAVWLQFFGETADAEDYRVSAGGYGAAAVVLCLAVIGILTHRGPRWLAWVALVSAVIFGLLAGNSAAGSAQAEPDPSPSNTAWDGIGGVLWAPWTWALVALGIHGLYRLTYGGTVGRGWPWTRARAWVHNRCDTDERRRK
jgi:hypothetical protein